MRLLEYSCISKREGASWASGGQCQGAAPWLATLRVEAPPACQRARTRGGRASARRSYFRARCCWVSIQEAGEGVLPTSGGPPRRSTCACAAPSPTPSTSSSSSSRVRVVPLPLEKSPCPAAPLPPPPQPLTLLQAPMCSPCLHCKQHRVAAAIFASTCYLQLPEALAVPRIRAMAPCTSEGRCVGGDPKPRAKFAATPRHLDRQQCSY